MRREFRLDNFTKVYGECDESTFTIYTHEYGVTKGSVTKTPLTTVTWAQLQAGLTLYIDNDKVYQVTVESNELSTNPTIISLGAPSCCNIEDVGVDADSFCFTFRVKEDDPTIKFNLVPGTVYDCIIYWGDGTNTTVDMTAGNYDNIKHDYPEGLGIKENDLITVAISGILPLFPFSEAKEKTGLITYSDLEVVSINSWGHVEMSNFESMCYNLDSLKSIPAGSIPAPSGAVDVKECFKKTFYGCTGLESLSHCNNLFSEFITVTDFNETFKRCSNMTNLPYDIFSGCTQAHDFHDTFNGCSKLQISKYKEGELYYTDRIYHNGDANYPNSGATPPGTTYRFTDTYMGCSGWQSFPIPYWKFYDTKDGLTYLNKGCYYGLSIPFSVYVKDDTLTPPRNSCTFQDWSIGRYVGGGDKEAQCDLENVKYSASWFNEEGIWDWIVD